MSLITITSSMGTGGITISRQVADALNLELYDDQRLQEEAATMGISSEDIESLDDWSKIPITTRLELQSQPMEERSSDEYEDSELRFSSTSGTTMGCPLRLAHDNDSINHKYVAKLRSWSLMGSTIGDSIFRMTPGENQACLIDGGRPELGVSNLLSHLPGAEDRRQKRFMFLEDKIIGPLFHRKRLLSPETGYLSWEEAESYLDTMRSLRTIFVCPSRFVAGTVRMI